MDEAAVDTWDCTSALMESQSGSASGAPRASWRRCGVLADDGRGLRAQHASGVSLLRAVLAEHVGIADDGRRVRPGVDDFNPSSQRQHALDQAAIMAQWLRASAASPASTDTAIKWSSSPCASGAVRA
jgi:hypothetical protein